MTYTFDQYVKHLHRAGPEAIIETAQHDLTEDELVKLQAHVRSYKREQRQARKERYRA